MRSRYGRTRTGSTLSESVRVESSLQDCGFGGTVPVVFPFLPGPPGEAIGMLLITAVLIAALPFGMFVFIVAVVALFAVVGLHHGWQRARRGAKSN